MHTLPLEFVRSAERLIAPSFQPFCRGCGTRTPQLGARAIGCPHCGAELVRVDGTRATSSRLTPWLHAACGAIVPGAGQALNGQLLRGVGVLLTCWLIVPWIWGIADAWRTAHRMAIAPAADAARTR